MVASATRPRVEEHRSTLASIREAALAAFRAWWRPTRTKPEIHTKLDELIREYGTEAAQAVSQFYDELREAQVPPSAPPYVASPDVPDFPMDAIVTDVNWAMYPAIQQGNPDASLGRIEQVLDRTVHNFYASVVPENAKRDPNAPRWARIPTGAETCAFCLIMASRGFIYTSQNEAGGGDEINRYHSHCDCVTVMDFTDDPAVRGYDPERLYELYLVAREKSGSGALTDIASAMRSLGITGAEDPDTVRGRELTGTDPRGGARTKKTTRNTDFQPVPDSSEYGEWLDFAADSPEQARAFVSEVTGVDGSVWEVHQKGPRLYAVREVRDTLSNMETLLSGKPRSSSPPPLPDPDLDEARPTDWTPPVSPYSPSGRRFLNDLTLGPEGAITWSTAGAAPGEVAATDAAVAMAVEMRMRGWNVRAAPSPFARVYTPQSVREGFWQTPPTQVRTQRDDLLGVLDGYPLGARGAMTFTWSEQAGFGAHTVNWTRHRDSVVFMDGVTGESYSFADLEPLMHSAVGVIGVERWDTLQIADLQMLRTAGEER